MTEDEGRMTTDHRQLFFIAKTPRSAKVAKIFIV